MSILLIVYPSRITDCFKSANSKEKKIDYLFSKEKFDFEDVLDECGFGYYEKLPSLLSTKKHLWKVHFY